MIETDFEDARSLKALQVVSDGGVFPACEFPRLTCSKESANTLMLDNQLNDVAFGGSESLGGLGEQRRRGIMHTLIVLKLGHHGDLPIDFGCLPLELVQAAVGGYQRQQAGEITAGAQRVPIQEMSQLGGVGDYHLAWPEQLLGFFSNFQVDIMGCPLPGGLLGLSVEYPLSLLWGCVRAQHQEPGFVGRV